MPESETSLNELLYELKRVAKSREVLTEEKIAAIYQNLIDSLDTFLAKSYKKYADADGRLYMSYLDAQRKKAWFLNEVIKAVDDVEPSLQKAIKSLVNSTYQECYSGMAGAIATADTAEKLARVTKGISLADDVLKQAVNNNVSKLTLSAVMQKHRAEIIYQIQQELTIGLMNGDRYETVAKRISERVGVSENKAKNIARTETHRNIESGFMDSAERIVEKLDGSDLIYAATWRTMNDNRVRPNVRYRTKHGWKSSVRKSGANHVQMEGVTVKVGEMFTLSDGTKTKAPGQSGVAAQDCNCRCFLEYNLMTVEEFAKATDQTEEQVRKKYGMISD